MSLRSAFRYDVHAYQTTPLTELDIFQPPAAEGSPTPRKTLVLFHGGGLLTGGRGMFIPVGLAAAVLAEGWIVVSADYSLLPQVSGASLLRDMAQLEAWLVAHAAAHGIDTDNIAVAGESAGVLVATLAAAHWRCIRPKALLDFFGMLDLTADWYTVRMATGPPAFLGTSADDPQEAEFAHILASSHVMTSDGYTAAPGGRARFLGWAFREGVLHDFYMGRHPAQRAMGISAVAQEMERELLPLRLADRMPPTWAIHGTADSLVPVDGSRRFVDALKAAAVEVEFVEVPDGEHGLEGLPSEQGTDLAVAFLLKWVR